MAIHLTVHNTVCNRRLNGVIIAVKIKVRPIARTHDWVGGNRLERLHTRGLDKQKNVTEGQKRRINLSKRDCARERDRVRIFDRRPEAKMFVGSRL